ncbi:MAG: hypothetical protein RIS52_1704 [Pseudomonadota bacterium]
MSHFDFVVIGAGIAGASVAGEIAGDASVLLLEVESQPGYHSTGRSNALWHETYGGPTVQPLTAASKKWFEIRGFLSPRPTVTIGRRGSEASLKKMAEAFPPALLQPVDRRALELILPDVRPTWDRGLIEVSSADIDVAGVHSSYLGEARRRGASTACDEALVSAVREKGHWLVKTSRRSLTAGVIVNAAGAWADDVALRCSVVPIGLQPYRRTIVQLRLAVQVAANLPMIMDIDGTFYFKPDSGNRIWLSPHDETPSSACDAAPEELDIALAIERFQSVVEWKVEVVERAWAGLRTFAKDRLPVYGFDTERTGFFWCAGQGGFGIQTAPAAAKLCSSLLLKTKADPMVAHLEPDVYAPLRLRLLA